MVVLTSEKFGSAHLSTNYMLYDGGGNFVATLMFTKLVAGGVLQAHTAAHQKDCIGADCFRLTHLILIVSNILALMGVAVVAVRSRSLYSHIAAAVRNTENLQASGGRNSTIASGAGKPLIA